MKNGEVGLGHLLQSGVGNIAACTYAASGDITCGLSEVCEAYKAENDEGSLPSALAEQVGEMFELTSEQRADLSEPCLYQRHMVLEKFLGQHPGHEELAGLLGLLRHAKHAAAEERI